MYQTDSVEFASEYRSRRRSPRFAQRVAPFLLATMLLSACESGSETGSSEEPNPNTPPISEGGTDSPVSSQELTKPDVALEFSGQVISLVWNGANATSYRILYWFDSEPILNQVIVSQASYEFVPERAGTYTILVEAYDDLGNSRFSDPQQLEVSL